MNMVKIEVYEDERAEWRFRVKAKNGKIIAQGEGYTTKQHAMTGVDALVRCMTQEPIVVVEK